MACVACQADPFTHSFEPLARHGSTTVFYTSFKNTKDYSNTSAILAHITGELGRIDLSGGWGWILDCKYMAMKHIVQMQVSIGIIRFLQSKYNGTLRFLYVVNGGTVLSTALTACYPFLSKEFIQRIHKLQGTPLELFEQLKELHWSATDLGPLMARLQREC